MSSLRHLWVLGLLAAGCDITAKPFSGTIVVMSVAGAQATAPGTHLELWARTQFNDIERINPINDDHGFVQQFPDGRPGQPFPDGRPGFKVVKAITMGDPCMIDANGNLLTTAAAYPTTITENGVMQDPEAQAATVRNRIRQLTPTTECDSDGHCGLQTVQLLGVVPWDETPAPTVAPGAPAADRLAACQMYWAQSPLSYTPNPAQITAPLHGTIYGFIAFQTITPPAGYDGIRIDTPVHLGGLQELFVTVEGSNVDPAKRGPVYLQGVPDPGGREVTHIDLTGQNVGGTASLIVDLSDDPVQF